LPEEKIDGTLEAKKKIEALLFSSGRRMTALELSKIAKESEETVKKQMDALQKEYDSSNSPMMIIQEGDYYKMTIREKYLSYVKKIVPKTDMNKTVLETLAIIAWKAPIMQSDVIRIRTNKGYDHIDQLEEGGFISKKRQGRSYMISLTQKFYDYFDLSSDSDLKKAFKRIDEMAKKAPNSELAKAVGKLEVYGNNGDGSAPDHLHAFSDGRKSEKPPITLIVNRPAEKTEPLSSDGFVHKKDIQREEVKQEEEKRRLEEEKKEDEIVNRMLTNEKKPETADDNKPGIEDNISKIEEGASAIEIAKKILYGDSEKKKPKMDLFDGQTEEGKDESQDSSEEKKDDSDEAEIDRIFSEDSKEKK
jgi:segregation and condensation protein B